MPPSVRRGKKVFRQQKRGMTETHCYQLLYGGLVNCVEHYKKKPFFRLVSPGVVRLVCLGGGGGLKDGLTIEFCCGGVGGTKMVEENGLLGLYHDLTQDRGDLI